MSEEGTGEAEGSGERIDEPPHDILLKKTFHQSIDEGEARLGRSWLSLVSTGLVGGLDVSLGVLAMLVVKDATGSTILGALAFTIGFIAVSLGKSELFTENFLVPVATVVAGKATVSALLRLWAVTAVMNLVAGWGFAYLIAVGLPGIRDTAVELGDHFTELPTVEVLALGVIAGALITLMTWMERGSSTELGKIVAVISAAFLLAAVPLTHVIVVSIKMFTALHLGAAVGYAEIFRIMGLAAVANMVGGLVLVTALRLAQVGVPEIRKEIQREKHEAREEEEEDEGKKRGTERRAEGT